MQASKTSRMVDAGRARKIWGGYHGGDQLRDGHLVLSYHTGATGPAVVLIVDSQKPFRLPARASGHSAARW